MAKQHLHHAQIGAMIEQMGGKGVAQRVRRKRVIDTGLARVALDDVPKSLARHTIAAPCGKQVIGAAIEQYFAARAGQESAQPTHCLFAQRNEPLAIALAQHPQHALRHVHLVNAQTHQF